MRGRSWGNEYTQPKVEIVENPAENISSPANYKDKGMLRGDIGSSLIYSMARTGHTRCLLWQHFVRCTI